MEYKANVFRQIGASNHTDGVRDEFDYYATSDVATKKFLDCARKNNIKIDKKLWECATGENHLYDVMVENEFDVVGTDIIERGKKIDGIIDFLALESNPYPSRSIITNPPYKNALSFLEKGLDIVGEGKQVILFLKIQFLEGIKRGDFFKDNPPRYVFIHSSRVNCAKGGRFDKYPSSAVCYSWFIFEKGFKGRSEILWID